MNLKVLPSFGGFGYNKTIDTDHKWVCRNPMVFAIESIHAGNRYWTWHTLWGTLPCWLCTHAHCLRHRAWLWSLCRSVGCLVTPWNNASCRHIIGTMLTWVHNGGAHRDKNHLSLQRRWVGGIYVRKSERITVNTVINAPALINAPSPSIVSITLQRNISFKRPPPQMSPGT